MPFVVGVEVAAQTLGVSVEFVRELIFSGQIEVNARGKVHTKSLLAYKERDDAERRKTADDLTRISQELDLP